LQVQATMTRRLCAFNETTSLFMAAVNCSDCAVGGGGLTTNCALFDFLLYTLVGGTLCAFGLVGNVLSFIVLYFGGDHSSKTAATIFLLRALAVADSLVLVTSLPLWVLEPVNVYTGHLGACHRFYMVAMPYLWPLYLMSLTATIMLTVLVSFHRYTAVCMPYHSVTLSSLSRCRRHVAYVAAAAILYNVHAPASTVQPVYYGVQRVLCASPLQRAALLRVPARRRLLSDGGRPAQLHHVDPPGSTIQLTYLLTSSRPSTSSPTSARTASSAFFRAENHEIGMAQNAQLFAAGGFKIGVLDHG